MQAEYQVGQAVALCFIEPGDPHSPLVIPKTAVTDIHASEMDDPLWYGGEVVFEDRPEPMYRVAGSPFYFASRWLRPIDPDAEYADETEEALCSSR